LSSAARTGIDPSLRDRADLAISLGRMVWPHMLVRVMLAEQIYRATTILAGSPITATDASHSNS
jgi:23S rRNA (pseudouridine1915-N3)-methyltransferase